MSYRIFSVASLVGLAAAVLLLGACASHKSAESGGQVHAHLVGNARKAKPDDKLVCFRKAKTGTHIVKMYCMTKAQYKAARREAKKGGQQFQDMVNRSPTPKCNGPSC